MTSTAPATSLARTRSGASRGLAGRLRGIVTGDLGLFARLPRGRLVGPVLIAAALVIGIAVGLGRFTAPDLYTESVPFLVAAVVVGCIARLPAMALWFAFVATDAVWVWQQASARPFDWPIDVLAGRAGAAVFLWLVAVSVPGLGRLGGGVMAGGGHRGGPSPAAMPAVVAGLITAALTYAWASYAPQVANGAMPRPPSSVLYVVQDAAAVLAVVAFFSAAIGWLLLRARGGPGGDAFPLIGRTREWSVGGILFRAGATSLTLLVFSSLIDGALDLLVILGGVIGGEVLALIARATEGLRRRIGAIPYLLRVGLSIGLPLLVIAGGAALFWGPAAPAPPTPFFPYALAFGVGLFAVRTLLLVEVPPRPATARVSTPLSATLILAGLAIAWLGMPATTLADDCTGFNHCAAAILAGAAAAAALPWLTMFGLGGFGGPMRERLDRWADSVQDEPPPPAEPDYWEQTEGGLTPNDAPSNPFSDKPGPRKLKRF